MLTYACKAWDLTEDVHEILRGLYNQCMQIITGQKYQESALDPYYNPHTEELEVQVAVPSRSHPPFG